MRDLMTDSARFASQGAAFETVTWLPAAERLPDDETTVLITLVGGSEPTWLGFLLDGEWRDACTGDTFAGVVTHWAEMPLGPQS
jgi:Protein of unknown function (DUF551)